MIHLLFKVRKKIIEHMMNNTMIEQHTAHVCLSACRPVCLPACLPACLSLSFCLSV